MQTDFDVIIVGGGPAGSATALQIAQLSPSLAARTLLVDAASFPRHKLCGGGIVRQSDTLLGCLGVRTTVPSVPIHEIRFDYAGGSRSEKGKSLFRVVRRDEFDHALLQEVKAGGVCVHEGVRMKGIQIAEDRIVLETDSGDLYRAEIVVGADGARSLVRRSLVGDTQSERFVALEVLTPGHDGFEGGESNTAVFDFTPSPRGLRGYVWDFPSVMGGQRIMNRGIGGSEWGTESTLKDHFAQALAEREISIDSRQVEGCGAPLYDPKRRQSSERVLLAGDAVGIDPWLGEGISVAISTGIIAGHTAAEAIERRDFRFDDYRERILASAVGEDLVRRRILANLFYALAEQPRGLDLWQGLGSWG